jgi:hypothetical protein
MANKRPITLEYYIPMAYKTNELYDKALEEIDKNNLFFIEDVVAYLGISKPTFYDHFPVDSNEMNDIKERLNKNKMRTKVSIRSKLHQSTSPAGLLALYKLLATEDERKALAMEYRDHTSNGEKIELPPWVKNVAG